MLSYIQRCVGSRSVLVTTLEVAPSIQRIEKSTHVCCQLSLRATANPPELKHFGYMFSSVVRVSGHPQRRPP